MKASAKKMKAAQLDENIDQKTANLPSSLNNWGCKMASI